MSTSKGSGRNSRQTKRPKTIDLEAKESAAKKAGEKPSGSSGAAGEPQKPSRPTGPQVKTSAEKLPPQPDQPGTGKASASQPEPSIRKDLEGKPAGNKLAGTAGPPPTPPPSQPVNRNPGEKASDGSKDQEKRGSAALFMAGAAGGVVALGLGAILMGNGMIGTGGEADPAVDTGATEIQSSIDTLRDRVAGLEGSQQADGSEALEAVSGRVDDLETRLAQLQENFAGLSQAAQQPGGDDDFASALNTSLMEDFEQRIAAAENTIQEMRAGGTQGGDFAAELNKSLMEDFEQRISAAEQTLGQLQPGEAAEGSQAGESVESEALSRLQARLEEETSYTASALNNYGERIGALSDRADELDSRLGEVSASVADLSEQRQARSGAEDRIARSVAANALRTAYERGEPFASLLASIQALTGELDDAAALEDQARRGVATAAELRQEFSSIASDIIDAASPPEGGMVSQLLSNAKSLVRVRPEGPLPGDSPEAVVSRIEDRLEKSDLGGALEEWESLPEEARQFSQGWAERLRERLEADSRLDAILAALQPGGNAVQPREE